MNNEERRELAKYRIIDNIRRLRNFSHYIEKDNEDLVKIINEDIESVQGLISEIEHELEYLKTK